MLYSRLIHFVPAQMPFRPISSALNHLLIQNSWASPRLARFAHKTMRFDLAPLSFSFMIQEDGSLVSTDAAQNPDALCVIPPSLLVRLAAQDETAYSEILTLGDAALLAEIFFLSRHLKWDTAEDLSHFFGDIAAEHIVATSQSIHQQLRSSAVSLAQSLSEYWTEERPVLAKPAHVATFLRQTEELRDDVARLEQRILRLPTRGHA